jgi:hypothetical protein
MTEKIIKQTQVPPPDPRDGVGREPKRQSQGKPTSFGDRLVILAAHTCHKSYTQEGFGELFTSAG